MLNINKYFYHDTWNLTASLGASLLDLDYKELNFGGGLLTIPNLFTSNNANVSGKLTYKIRTITIVPILYSEHSH